MGRRLPDYDPDRDGEYSNSKRRIQLFKRVYQNYFHWQSLRETGEVDDVLSVDGEEIYIGDLMTGIETLPLRQRQAFELICLRGYTESAATAKGPSPSVASSRRRSPSRSSTRCGPMKGSGPSCSPRAPSRSAEVASSSQRAGMARPAGRPTKRKSVRVPDAPRADEIVVALVVTTCGRPHPRIGGLKMSEAKKEDGLR